MNGRLSLVEFELKHSDLQRSQGFQSCLLLSVEKWAVSWARRTWLASPGPTWRVQPMDISSPCMISVISMHQAVLCVKVPATYSNHMAMASATNPCQGMVTMRSRLFCLNKMPMHPMETTMPCSNNRGMVPGWQWLLLEA